MERITREHEAKNNSNISFEQRNIKFERKRGQKKFELNLQVYLIVFMLFDLFLLFRAENITEAFGILKNILTLQQGNRIDIPVTIVLILVTFILIEWYGRRSEFAIQKSFKKYPIVKRVFIYIIIISIFMFGKFNSNYEFIYFQF